MKRHLVNNRITYSVIVSMMQSIILGIYLAIYSDKIVKGYTLINAFRKLRYYNFFILISLVLFCVQVFFGILERSQESNDKENLVNSILRASCNTLIYPDNELHIRAIITVCDYNNKTRTTRYSYNIESAPERTAKYSLYFGVTGQAVLSKVPIAEELPENHINTYLEENGRYVEPDLKCVLAAPIFSLQNKSKVVAVLAFDSIEPLKKMKFDTRKSREIAQMWADVLSHIIE